MSGSMKSWWSGDIRVEKYMRGVSQAINRHIPFGTQSYTDVYNRCYEAVYQAIKDCDQKNECGE